MSCEHIDEVLCSQEVDKSKMSRIDRILTILEETLQSEEFMNIQDDFADRHCDIFTPNEDLPPQAMKIYQEYVQMIEQNLINKVQEQEKDFDFEELLPVLTQHKNDEGFEYANVFEFLNAAVDFTEFRLLMESYKAGKGIEFEVTTVKLED